MNRKKTEILVERYFLERIKDQFTYMPINEALDFNDRKEIQKLIRNDINSRKFRQELQKAFRNDFEDGIRAAFGINRQGKLSNYVVDKVSAELSSGGSRKMIANICKEVIAKLYKEIALRYPFIIKNLKL
tara:strand:+ start:438 stop:827 length:390 start_codon:yes stop_codon:yes gene_type:complete